MDKEIDKKNEIVNILNNIRLKHISCNIFKQENNFTIPVFISKVDLTSVITVYADLPEIIYIKDLKLIFEYSSNFYISSNTSLRILNNNLKSIELNLPEKIRFHPKRKYERINLPPNSFSLEIIELPNITNKLHSKITDDMTKELKEIYTELESPNPDLKKILNMVSNELRKFTNKFRINIFKPDNPLAPIEKVVKLYNKIFWIEDVDNLNSYIHIRDQYNIIGYEKYFEMIKKTLTPSLLEDIRHSYLSRNILSYAMLPINIGEDVVGIIELMIPKNDENYKKPTIYDIYYIKGLAEVISEVIIKSRDKDGQSKDLHFTPINFSIGGILANTKNTYITHLIKEGDVIKFKITDTDIKEIIVPAKVIRFAYTPGDKAGINIGFEFDYDKETTRKLMTDLFNKYKKLENK